MSGGLAALSHATEHAPVGTVGSAAVGSKQGAHRSSSPHVALGSRSFLDATSGMHVDRHRPSEPATDVQAGGTPFPPVATSESGAQNPAAPSLLGHLVSCACCAAG